MKRIHIFKPGTHTSAAGATIQFSESDLRASVAAYDPALHEAPIVVGHPRDNGPAYGWVGKLEYSDTDGIFAEPKQVEAQFSELVEAGRFKKVSASFYAPDAPTNPKPGVYYLRHVGFLGAQPPAIKGLKAVEFGEAEEGVVEFADLGTSVFARVLRNLREWLIDKHSREDADQIVNAWDLELLEDEARRPEPTENSYSEPEQGQAPETPSADATGGADNPVNPTHEGDTVDPKELEELRAAKAERDALKAKEAEFAEREHKLQKQELRTQIEAIARQGRVLAADVDHLTEFAANLNNDAVIEFGESDEQKQTARAHFLAWLGTLPKRVEFREVSGDDNDPELPADPTELAREITNYQEAQRAKGVTLSVEQALRDVKAGKHKEG